MWQDTQNRWTFFAAFFLEYEIKLDKLRQTRRKTSPDQLVSARAARRGASRALKSNWPVRTLTPSRLQAAMEPGVSKTLPAHGVWLARQEWVKVSLQKCPPLSWIHQKFSFNTHLTLPSLRVCPQDALLYQRITGAAHLPSRVQGYPNWTVFSRGASDCGESIFPLEPHWPV